MTKKEQMYIFNMGLSQMINSQTDLTQPIYVIASYWLGEFKGVVGIYSCDGDNDFEEIKKFFMERYAWTGTTFGVTEQTYKVMRIDLKEVLNHKGEFIND